MSISRVIVGRVHSLWRYPVKSMAGEELSETFVSFAGLWGDRLYAFHSSRARPDFPYLTAREKPAMLLYQAHFQESGAAGEGTVVVDTPCNERLPIDDPQLLSLLSHGLRDGEIVTLLHSERAMTDCHPISLFSIQSVRGLGIELHKALDLRRFRSNIYADFSAASGFAEDEFVGHKLQFGSGVIVHIVERDQRCKIITLDPRTAEADPDVIRQVARAHGGCVGVYGTVLAEGVIRGGDEIALLS